MLIIRGFAVCLEGGKRGAASYGTSLYVKAEESSACSFIGFDGEVRALSRFL